MPQKTPKMIRIIRLVTTITDVDLESYFDFVPADPPSVPGATVKRYWSAEEAMAYEKGRGQADQMAAFELALENDEMSGHLVAFDVLTVQTDERTTDEKAADEHGATYLTPSRDTDQAGYEANARAGLLGT